MSTNDFQKLVALLEKQTELLGSIASRLGSVAPTVTPAKLIEGPPKRRSTYDAHKYSKGVTTREWDDDYGWAAAMELALQKMGQQVKAWSEGLDTTLIFLGLFSAVVTAVLVPTSQNLSQLPDQYNDQLLMNLTNIIYQIAQLNHLQVPDIVPLEPFKPAASDEISAWFWYTSLVISILCAGLTVFTRIQMPDLPVVPEGLGTKLVHKIRRLQLRDKLCKKLILPTLDVVNWAMIVAILVFLVGLLFQLWNTHFQTSGRLLLSCAIIGTALAVLVLGFIVILTLHAVFSDESPFETTFSTWVRSKFRGARLSPNLEPEPQAAAEYLGGLLSNCNDVKSLERAALVFVECFRFLVYNDQKSSLDLDPAIIQILRHDTSPEVKLSVLQGIPQMTRPPNPESNPDSQLGRPSETVLVRLLFRIQEDNSMPFEDLGKAAFRGLIHLSVKANLDDAESSESSVSDYTVRGLRHCAPAGLASDGQMPPAFLGSILAWSSLPDEEQVEVLSRVPLNSLIFSFIVATFWAHRESISGDTRLKRLEKLLYQPIYLDYLEQRFSGRLFDLPKSSGLRFRISKLMRHLKPKSKEDIEPRIHRWLKIYHQSSAKQPRPLGRRSIYQQILDHLGVTIRVVIHEKTDLDFPTLGLLRGLSPLLDEMKICSAAFDGEPRPATQTALALLDILGEIRDSIVREQGRPEGETGDLSMLRWSPLASIVLKSIQRFLDDRTEGDQTVLPQFYHLEVLAYCLNHFNPTLGSRNPKYDGDDDDNDAIFGFLQRCDGFALEDLPALDGSDDDRVRHDFESMKSEVRAALDKFPKKASAQANADKTGTETTQGAPSSPVPAQSSSPEKSGEPKNTSPALDDATSIVVEQADADSSSPTPGTNAGPSETVETERPTRPSMSLILRSQSYIGLERPASPGSVV